MDKLLKISVIVACLLAGFGIFFHYVIYLPGVEQRKIEKERAEKQAAESEAAVREARRRFEYESCLKSARQSYDLEWASACKRNANTTLANLKNCLASKLEENYCRSAWGSADVRPDCALPGRTADRINKSLEDERARCLAEAKLF